MVAAPAVQEAPASEWKGFPRISIANGIPSSESGEAVMDTAGMPILSAGAFHLNGTDIYAKSFKLRPLKYMFSYINYDAEFKVKAQSIYTPMGRGYYEPGILDSAGGERCGRPDPIEMAKLSEDVQKAKRSMHPLYVTMFGLAYFPTREPMIIELRMGKKKLYQLSVAVEKAVKATFSGKINRETAAKVYEQELAKHMLEVSLTPTRDPKGNLVKAPTGNPIWELAVSSVGYNQSMKDIIEPMQQVVGYINDVNNQVTADYAAAKAGAKVVDEVMEDAAPWDTADE